MLEYEYRNLSHVPRWSIVPTIKNQSVAEHSFYVALYTYELISYFDLDKVHVGRALLDALTHDRDESFTGDIPGPVKRNANFNADWVEEESENRFKHNSFKYPSDRVPKLLKVANLMDEYAFLKTEEKMGNRMVIPVLDKVEERLVEAALCFQKAFDLREGDVNSFLEEFWEGADKFYMDVVNNDGDLS